MLARSVFFLIAGWVFVLTATAAPLSTQLISQPNALQDRVTALGQRENGSRGVPYCRLRGAPHSETGSRFRRLAMTFRLPQIFFGAQGSIGGSGVAGKFGDAVAAISDFIGTNYLKFYPMMIPDMLVTTEAASSPASGLYLAQGLDGEAQAQLLDTTQW